MGLIYTFLHFNIQISLKPAPFLSLSPLKWYTYMIYTMQPCLSRPPRSARFIDLLCLADRGNYVAPLYINLL